MLFILLFTDFIHKFDSNLAPGNTEKPGETRPGFFPGVNRVLKKPRVFFPGAKSRFSGRKKPGLFRVSGSGDPAGPGANPGRYPAPSK